MRYSHTKVHTGNLSEAWRFAAQALESGFALDVNNKPNTIRLTNGDSDKIAIWWFISNGETVVHITAHGIQSRALLELAGGEVLR